MAYIYDDLEIEFGRCTCHQAGREVRILASPIDRPREPLDVNDAEIDRILNATGELDAQVIHGGAIRGRQRELAVDIGTSLYQLVMRGKVGATVRQSLISVQSQHDSGTQAGLRIRFSFGTKEDYDPRLVRLPWELLCDPEDQTFFCESPATPIVRYLDVSKVVRVPTAKAPLKILAIMASPSHPKLNPVDIEAHRLALEAAADRAGHLKFWFLAPDTRPSLDAMHRMLREHEENGEPFHAVHFLGHGVFDQGQGVLCFEHDDCSLQKVSGTHLAKELSRFHDLRLVVLATCSGAKMADKAGQNPFAGVASALVAARLPAVVAMQFPVSQRAAEAFTGEFYERLGSQRSVDIEQAVVEGRAKIARQDTDSMEWASPVLFLRSASGQILDLEGAEPPVRKVAIYNMDDHGGYLLQYPARSLNLSEYFVPSEDRRRAYIKSRDYWPAVKGEVTSFLSVSVPATDRYHFLLAVPLSIAYTVGYFLEINSGHDVRSVGQRGKGGAETVWKLSGEPPANAADWLPIDIDTSGDAGDGTELPLDSDSSEVLVAVSISRPALPGIAKYLRDETSAPKVGAVIHADIDCSSRFNCLADGAHALRLASRLVDRLHVLLSGRDRPTVHLMICGPNAFAFVLGRLSKVLPKVQLYEYDITGAKDGTYSPSISLPD